MTNKELNRDIKRLFAKRAKMNDCSVNNSDYFEFIEKELKPEFKRLYGADNSAESLTVDNLKRMIIINRIYQIVPFHLFFININEAKL